MSKKFKHVLISLALASVVTVSAAASACTIKTKHPRAKITIEFNDETYDIEYTLYRNMYPKTVQHFIELADEGFYDNMIIHNYSSTDWYTGGYSYSDSSETLSYSGAYDSNSMREYLETYCKEEAYYSLAGKLSPSVYKQLRYDGDKEIVSNEDVLPTLIGEFKNNDHNIEKGALTADYGTLKMYYYDKGADNHQKVAIVNSFDQILEHDYRYNCATSIFAIQTSESSSINENNYCVFARLRNDKARNTLNSLADAVTDYISDNYSNTSRNFTTSITTQVDNLDSFAGEGGQAMDATFSVTAKPIIVKSVKITKY
ncbi:MAG: peptidylprolyl isomerase [Clostridia bacterium]|nr:peptidylprolyl isomerase [Clostridia bacterium]